MTKKIQRTTDKKFVLSVADNTWVDNINQAFEFSPKQAKEAMDVLVNTYPKEQLIEFTNAWKNKGE